MSTLTMSSDWKRRGQMTGLLLLTGQLLTIASILLLVSVGDLRTPSNVSLKILASGACLLEFGMVLVSRRSRIDSMTQKQLDEELRTTNEKIVTSLTAARDGIEARNQFLTSLRDRMKNIVRRTATLLETDLTDQQRGYAQTSLLAAESLAAAITNVLYYSKLSCATWKWTRPTNGFPVPGEFHPALLKSKNAGVAAVRVLDMSATGLQVSLPFRLALNTEVEICVEDDTISGLVRTCVRHAATEFHVGIKVSEPVSGGRFSFDQVLRRPRA